MPTKTAPKWSREGIAKLSPAEFDQHRDSIVDWMRAGGSSAPKPTGSASTSGGKGRSNGTAKGKKKPLSRKLIAEMSDAEYEARRDEIAAWVYSGGGTDSTRPTGG